MIRVCTQCSGQIKNYYAKRCGNCAGRFKKGLIPWNKGLTGIMPSPPNKGTTNRKERICEFCNSKFLHIREKPTKYCSQKCYHEAQVGRKRSIEYIQRISGANAWNWKGGTQSLDHLARVKFRKTIQKLVLKRDNYTCQICKKYGGYLQVDHIQSWAEYVDQRFNMDNCRTLCMGCHYFITFGKKKPQDIIWGHNFKYTMKEVD